MTWLWPICFSLAAFPVLAATVTGRVELIASRDPAVRKARDFSGVVVWLESFSPRGDGAVPARPPREATMDQRDKSFQPHVLAIQVGAVVNFPNSDPIFHNAFSNFDGQIFDIGLYPPGTSRRVLFRRPGIVRVFCNIHPMMSAVIVVLQTPWFATTDASGHFRMEGVPPDEYRLKVFHERALAGTLEQLEQRVTVGAGSVALPLLRLSESGWVPAPHGNKYGKDYPAVVDDHIVYPGAKR
jgi:plastocyanin